MVSAAPSRHLESDEVERLRVAVSGSEQPAAAQPTNAVPLAAPPQPPGIKALAKAQLKRVIHRAIAWYVDPRVDLEVARAEERLRIDLSDQLPRPGSNEDVHALATNQQLLKGEVRYVVGMLNDLAEAIAPTAGIAGAATRLAQLREQMNDVDRRLRRLINLMSTPAGSAAPASRSAADPATSDADLPSTGSSFDYLGFERRFRGDSESLVAVQRDRYLDLLREHGPVLDVGCGRGELVGSLTGEGIEAEGIDIDAESVDEAVAQGRNVRRSDVIETLRAAAPGSFGAIISLQVVEHLQLESLLEMLELAVQRLRPGGLFIAETPNPMSMIVLSTHYIMDPTHVRPLHPALLAFLCERAGFREIELRYFDPATTYWLPTISGEHLPDWAAQVDANFERLNRVLFGPQDYAVVARTPQADPGESPEMAAS